MVWITPSLVKEPATSTAIPKDESGKNIITRIDMPVKGIEDMKRTTGRSFRYMIKKLRENS